MTIYHSEDELSSTSKGSHAELIAQAAFIAAGYDVLLPIVPCTYDFAVTKDGRETVTRIQVKMLSKRLRDGVEYYVLKTRRNTGNPYTLEETDLFAGICDGKVYVTENRVLSELWCKVDEADMKWQRLDPLIK